MALRAGPGYKAGMRIAVLFLTTLALTSAAAAETLRLPTEQPQSGKTLPLKGTTGAARTNACASYGLGFTMVEGTCVKIGGTVRVDAVGRR